MERACLSRPSSLSPHVCPFFSPHRRERCDMQNACVHVNRYPLNCIPCNYAYCALNGPCAATRVVDFNYRNDSQSIINRATPRASWFFARCLQFISPRTNDSAPHGIVSRYRTFLSPFRSPRHFHDISTGIRESLRTRVTKNHDDPSRRPGDRQISLQPACPETSIALTNVIERKIKFYSFKSKKIERDTRYI